MRFFKIEFYILLLLMILTGCQKEEMEHPQIKTGTITALSPIKFRITGEIVHTGTYKIQDYGFIYGFGSYISEENGTKVSLGQEASSGTVTKDISITGINYGYERTVYARLYLKNEKGTAYGDIINIQLPVTSVSSLVPSTGKAGEQIAIYGNFSTLNKEDLEVTFGSTAASIESVTPTKLMVTVPSGINTTSSSNEVIVKVFVSGSPVGGNSVFYVSPTVHEFSPKSGTINSTVILSATNLPLYSYYGTIRVYFGNTQAAISSNTRTSLSVLVPETLTETNPVISVEYNGTRTNLPGTFSVIPHTITSVSPASGLPGSTFLINGTNMPTASFNSANSSVKIGTHTIYPAIVSNSQLRAVIPDLTPGTYDVSVTYGPYTAKSAEKLTIESISATSFSPSSGGVGREITIQGKFNPSQSYQVLFGATTVYSYNVTATALKVNVPPTTTYGPLKITVKSGLQSVEASGQFTVLAPSITSFSPASGVAGTVVTISGSGFTPSNSYYSSNTVRFGTVSTNVISATESTITAVVPSNLTPGAMKITVVNANGQTIVSSSNFTVTN